MGSTTFSGPFIGDITGNVTGSVTVPSYTVETAPEDAPEGAVIFVSDGAAGDPILAFGDGTNWLRSDTGAAISDS